MGERFSEIEKASIDKRSLEERLKEYPELAAKLETMLSIIENAGGDVEKAAEAERRIIEEMRQMGNEVLHGWARRQQQKKEEEYSSKAGVNRKKKNALLVHATWKNQNSGADLYPRPAGAGDPAVFGIGGSGVSRLLAGITTGDDRLWRR